MKKLALISLISIFAIGMSAHAELIRQSNFYGNDTLEGVEQEFFETGTIQSPENKAIIESGVMIEDDYDDEYYNQTPNSNSTEKTLKAMPVFKKYRIKISNYFKIKAHEEELKEIEYNKQLEEFAANSGLDIDDDEIRELAERKLKKIYQNKEGEEVKISPIKKVKNFFKRNKTNDGENTPSKVEKSDDTETTNKTLSAGVSEVVAQKDIVLDCDKLVYDDETSDLEATGHAMLSFPPQGVSIKGDKLIYNTEGNIIKAFGNVEIIKNGSSIYGDYIQINMNDESAIVTNMHTDKMNMLVNAKNVVASEDTIELQDGYMVGSNDYILRLKSRMVGPRIENMMIAEDDKSKISGQGLAINVKASEIFVTAKKNHNTVTLKNADLYFKDNFITRLGSFTAHTNKNNEYFQANYPELGSIPRIGMFIGPGYVFDLPNGATIKAIPFLNYKNELGIGGGLKYRSGTNFTSLFYGSAADIFVLKGKQYLDDRLYLQYGINSFLEDWYMGGRIAKYALEAVYRDSTKIPDTLGKNRSATYRQRISAGYVQDGDYNTHHESINSSEIGTTRFKYMAELSQNLFSYKDKEKRQSLSLSWIMQGSAALYGTGDTQFVGRTGPMLHSQYKNWMQDIGYFVSAIQDETPVPRFDTYRYGRSNVYLRESLRVNKYFTVSWMGSAALSNDAPNGELFQENGFYFALGPDDLKFTFGYDFIRGRTFFTFTTALDMKDTRVDYKRMVIKNPDRLTKEEEKIEPVSFKSRTVPKVKRTHAQVIDIEDPDREQI